MKYPCQSLVFLCIMIRGLLAFQRTYSRNFAFRPGPHTSLVELFSFQPGDRIQVEVTNFGPLGGSVDVVAKSHDANDVLAVGEEPLATGLVLQTEIKYFREARDHVDVVRGELLPAFVERVRDDGKLDISLREYGGYAKAQSLTDQILKKLEEHGGVLPVGDKSPPEEISEIFPGTSKSTFKKAVANLYKKGEVTPSPDKVILNNK